MSYRHGVYASEVPTSIVPPVRVDVSLPVVWGTAPVQTLDAGTPKPINEPKLIFSMADFVRVFGSLPEDAAAADYTLYEFADIYLTRYRVAPIVCINVFDPEIHTGGVTEVTAADIIGGIDGETKEATGLELVDKIYPLFGLIPGQLLAPKFSGDPALALSLGAKAANINGHFKATAIIDIPETVTHYTDAPAWLDDNNLLDTHLMAFLGSPTFGAAAETGSSHLAGVVATRDYQNSSIPFWSPSNQRLLANGLGHAGKELALGPSEASYLNGQGIVTGLNFVGAMVAWGNRTTAYPGITDVKDSFIPVRRMFNYCSNSLVVTAWQFLDRPIMLRRLIDTVIDSYNVWLNGLRAREFILGGRVEFLGDDNPTTDIMDGIARFRVYFTPASPAREMDFILEYDPGYISTLFGVNNDYQYIAVQ